MAATDLISNLLQYHCDTFSKNERTLIELYLFNYLYQELLIYFQQFYDDQREENMPNGVIIHSLVNDLISSNEYSVQALATYTGYPEDVIYDLAGGLNLNPTLALSAKIIELHALTRRDLYNEIIKKIFYKINEGV